MRKESGRHIPLWLHNMLHKELADLPLLPGDVRHILNLLTGYNEKEAYKHLQKYKKIWKKERRAEPNRNKKDNAGRNAANLYLVSLIDVLVDGLKKI
jgi:hypothetical protein